MQAAKKETVFEFPEGGIADFYMTDEQFAELERREQVGHGGITNVHHIADRIAEYGRYGDDTLAHVETGELIVPKALLEKTCIERKHFRASGRVRWRTQRDIRWFRI